MYLYDILAYLGHADSLPSPITLSASFSWRTACIKSELHLIETDYPMSKVRRQRDMLIFLLADWWKAGWPPLWQH